MEEEFSMEDIDRLVEEAHNDTSTPGEESLSPVMQLLNTVAESSESTETPIINEADLIPETIKTSDIETTTSRFSSAIWYDRIREQDITIAGIGGIGSYVGFLLSRMHPHGINIYDPDIVELGNLSGQLYDKDSIGVSKIHALSSLLQAFSDYYSIYSYRENFTRTSPCCNILICGFDNMEARKEAFLNWKFKVTHYPEKNKKNCLFIDGRLAAEEFQIFCIKGDDEENILKYEDKWLFSEEEAETTVCSYKQTSFCANMIASYMVNYFVNFIANQCDPLIEREVPFFTYYDASIAYLKIER